MDEMPLPQSSEQAQPVAPVATPGSVVVPGQEVATPVAAEPPENHDEIPEPEDDEAVTGTLVDDSGNRFSWQASEFIHHQKQTVWYAGFVIVVVLLVGVAVITKQWFSVAVFVAMAGALLVYAKKEPRILNYQVDSDGMRVEGKLYRYDQFRSFSVFNDVAWHSIDLDPAQRFLPRLTVLFESNNLDHILPILSEHLPRIDRQPDLVERLTRSLKF